MSPLGIRVARGAAVQYSMHEPQPVIRCLDHWSSSGLPSGLQLKDLSGSDSQPSSALENHIGTVLFSGVAAAGGRRLDLAPSFRLDSSAAGALIQDERKVRLVDSRKELSTRRFAARRAIASLPSSQQRE